MRSAVTAILISGLCLFSCKAREGNSGLAQDNNQAADANAKDKDKPKNLFEELDLKTFDLQTSTFILDGCAQLHGLLGKGLEVYNKRLEESLNDRIAQRLVALNIDTSKLKPQRAAMVEAKAKTLWNYRYEILPVAHQALPFRTRRPTNVTEVVTRVFEGGSYTPIVFINRGADGMTMDIIEPSQMYQGLSGTGGWLWGIGYNRERCKVTSRYGTITSIVRSKTTDGGSEQFLYNATVNGRLANFDEYQTQNFLLLSRVIYDLDSALWKSARAQRAYLLAK